MSDWKHFFCKAFSEAEFYGDLVYKFRKIIDKIDFPYHFKKIIVRYKKIGYNINVMRQTACLVVNPIKHTCHKLWAEICEIRQNFKWDLIKFCETFTKIAIMLPKYIFIAFI